MKKGFVIAAVLLILVFIGLALYFTLAPTERQAPDYSEVVRIPEVALPPSSVPAPEPENTPEPTPYVSPIDFEALWERNTDIYAWLDIPNTDISYPVVQNEDDSYYLNHNSDGDYSGYGAIYSESAYNGGDFSDGLTVLYGHRMNDGSMFGNLQRYYSEKKALEDYKIIRVYLPDKMLEFEVFAAVPYDKRHIMYNYGGVNTDGGNELRQKRSFLYSVYGVYTLDAQLSGERFPALDDPLIVLSTCLRGDRSKRFIVAGKLVSES